MQEDPERESVLVPYAPDFTPATLGKTLGEDAVLGWLLRTADAVATRADLQQAIVDQCFQHIGGGDEAKAYRNRRDMASHVVGGMVGYGLIRFDDENRVELTPIGREVLGAEGQERDRRFARQIITSCNGHRLLDLLREYRLRGETPQLEDLAEALDLHRTAKSVSTMRAWLARAGIFDASGYRLNEDAVDQVLGSDVGRLLGLDGVQLEFVLAARTREIETGSTDLRASEVADLAESRRPDIKIRRKSLNGFVEGLIKVGVAVAADSASGKGGSGRAFRLQTRASALADEEVRRLVGQTEAGFDLRTLRPLEELRRELDSGSIEDRGWVGEMLAVHACLMLGLRVLKWRARAPGAEIDLLADRTAGLSYQRWAIQVKNTDQDLGADRVDREIGAAAGVGVTHILFVVPRAALTTAAEREITVRSRLTSLHIFALTKDDFGDDVAGHRLAEALRRQSTTLARYKQDEARRRDGV